MKKDFSALDEGATATFDVVAVTADGKRTVHQGVHWSLYRISNDYQSYNSDGRWNFARVSVIDAEGASDSVMVGSNEEYLTSFEFPGVAASSSIPHMCDVLSSVRLQRKTHSARCRPQCHIRRRPAFALSGNTG